MRVLIDLGALFAVLLLGYLFYLVLFERGALYRTNTEVHGLGDRQRLRLLGALLETPPLHIESFRVIREGPELYDVQLEAIAAAKRSIHLEAYIFYPGRISERFLAALCERARSGVYVRVVIDAIGSLRLRKSYFEPLIAAGGRVTRYHPLHLHMLRRWNSRTHRNLLVVDGEVGFIGGAGIADHWCRSQPPPWRDCALRVTGPIVAGLQAVFAENWLESMGELLVSEDAFPNQIRDAAFVDVVTPGLAVGSTPTAGRSTRARVLVQFLLATARESIDICSPYFVPDLGIRQELIAARARGVRVRVLTGGPYSDHGLVRRAGRRRYGVLLKEGVEIAEYNSRMMHAKVLLVDGRWALLGSTNIDNRSFGLNDEVNLLVLSEALASRLRAAFEEDLSQSTVIDLHAWLNRSWGERILATLGRVLERHQ
ncbi:MAG TPA: phospholipase D-like domain-containing protein [Steroidobacter sp.]|uniref:phospholipase D-like domain-containing protein n=1 Tax=Steroidobacter sp. TaxID=1978227 RepID=UPI002ED8A0AB